MMEMDPVLSKSGIKNRDYYKKENSDFLKKNSLQVFFNIHEKYVPNVKIYLYRIQYFISIPYRYVSTLKSPFCSYLL